MTLRFLFSMLSFGTVLNTALLTIFSSLAHAQLSVPEDTSLDVKDALIRSRQVENVSYSNIFYFKSQKESAIPSYEGKTEIRFFIRPEANKKQNFLRIDAALSSIRGLAIQGRKVMPEEYSQWIKPGRLEIPLSQWTKAGIRDASFAMLSLEYSNAFLKNQDGFIYFKDPEDQTEYMYTNLEPFAAHRVFPCLDQPDLKATYDVTVIAPKNWKAIANAPLASESAESSALNKWIFKKTKPFSTYVFALALGQFEEFKDSTSKIPLRLFTRQSMKAKADPARWFEITRKGFEFFESLFGVEYPFEKYDQLVVPEMYGAMENVGAVTFSENFVFDSTPTQRQLYTRTETILHELSHMWFGNLVTMRWWNGLWLNESFATFVSEYAIRKLKLEPDGLENYYRNTYIPGLLADTLPSSHPVESEVLNTDQAMSIFDEITYQKGSALLRQIVFLVTEDGFKKSLQNYFKKHAYKNTVAQHFFESIQTLNPEKVSEKWIESWYKSKGVNRVTPVESCQNKDHQSEIEEIQFTQSAESSESAPTRLRPLDFNIKIWTEISGTPTEFKVHLSGQETTEKWKLPSAIKCPKFILVNSGAFGFFKASLPSSMLQVLKTQGLTFSTLLTRVEKLQVWRLLKDAVIEGKLSVSDYIDLIQKYADTKDPTLVKDLFTPLFYRYPESVAFLELVSDIKRAVLFEKLFLYAKGQLFDSNTQDQKTVWFEILLESIFIPEHTREVAGWLIKSPFKAFDLNTKRKFDLRRALLLRGHLLPLDEKTLKAEDPSPRFRTRYATLKMLEDFNRTMGQDSMRTWIFHTLLNPDHPDSVKIQSDKVIQSLSRNELLTIMRGSRPFDDRETARQNALDFYKLLDQAIQKNLATEELSRILTHTFPRVCEESFITLSEGWIQSHTSLHPSLKNELLDLIYSEKKCVKTREKPDVSAKTSLAPMKSGNDQIPAPPDESPQNAGTPAPMR